MPHSDDMMTPQQRAVWLFLIADYVGPRKAEPRHTLIARFEWRHKADADLVPLPDREFRQICADLVVHFAKPVCTSSAGGYFVAETPDDLDQAVRDLESRAVAILERARALKATLPLSLQRRLF